MTEDDITKLISERSRSSGVAVSPDADSSSLTLSWEPSKQM